MTASSVSVSGYKPGRGLFLGVFMLLGVVIIGMVVLSYDKKDVKKPSIRVIDDGKVFSTAAIAWGSLEKFSCLPSDQGDKTSFLSFYLGNSQPRLNLHINLPCEDTLPDKKGKNPNMCELVLAISLGRVAGVYAGVGKQLTPIFCD